MAVSDDKQNRLSTLSQDVIAVPKKPAAPSRAPEPRAAEPRATEKTRALDPRQGTSERKAIPASQDVFRVNAGAEEQDVFVTQRSAPQPPPAYTPPPAYSPPPVQAQPAYMPPRQPRAARMSPAESTGPTAMTLVTAGIAALALLVAIYGATRGTEANAADPAALEKLTAELRAANERVEKLEMALSAASADAQKMSSPNQGNVLQISAGMRELRNDVDGVANDVAKLSAEIGEIRSVAGAASGQAKVTASQVEQIATRVSTLGQQVASAPRGGAAPATAAAPANAETQAQVKALSARTEKMANDIRQLYRLVGGE
jgi:hypothetical protein